MVSILYSGSRVPEIEYWYLEVRSAMDHSVGENVVIFI